MGTLLLKMGYLFSENGDPFSKNGVFFFMFWSPWWVLSGAQSTYGLKAKGHDYPDLDFFFFSQYGQYGIDCSLHDRRHRFFFPFCYRVVTCGLEIKGPFFQKKRLIFSENGKVWKKRDPFFWKRFREKGVPFSKNGPFFLKMGRAGRTGILFSEKGAHFFENKWIPVFWEWGPPRKNNEVPFFFVRLALGVCMWWIEYPRLESQRTWKLIFRYFIFFFATEAI